MNDTTHTPAHGGRTCSCGWVGMRANYGAHITALVAPAFGGTATPATAPPAWFCDAHGLSTTGDCPRCDDELISVAAMDGVDELRDRIAAHLQRKLTIDAIDDARDAGYHPGGHNAALEDR